MLRWLCLLLLCLAMMPALAEVDIIDLQDQLEDRYDLTWEVKVEALPTAALQLQVETTEGSGYLLQLEKDRAVWQQAGATPAVAPVQAPLTLEAGKRYQFSLKRRPGTIALLMNHRLALCVPAPTPAAGTLTFGDVPQGMAITEARYLAVGLPMLGDDFMRPESVRQLTGKNTWYTDRTWQVVFYKKENPGMDPRNPQTGELMTSPWNLSISPVTHTSTNGFMFLYTGVGPSCTVASPTISYPTWDQYYVQAAVKPDSQSEVGVIAAFQDLRNYILFRWRQDDATARTPRAELLAMIDGKGKVLASSARGFTPAQWYTVRINLGWQRVQALVDGQVVLEADNPGTIEGRVGLYADGVENPWRPKADTVVTRGEKTADGAQPPGSCSYFDDVRVGEWLCVPDLFTRCSYVVDKSGAWKEQNGVMQAETTAGVVGGPAGWRTYTATTRVKIPQDGSATVLFHQNEKGAGYRWQLSAAGQELQTTEGSKIVSTPVGLKPGEWADLRVEADGPYVALYCNDTRVMDYYDRKRMAGRCGIQALTPGVSFAPLAITRVVKKREHLDVNDEFENDSYMKTWAGADANWYPSFKPDYSFLNFPNLIARPPAALPIPTTQKGLYWYKGQHFGDLRVTIPVSIWTINGQTLHLSGNYQPTGGYRLVLNKSGKDGGTAQWLRGEQKIGEYPFKITPRTQLVLERRGTYLMLAVQDLDPEDTASDPEILKETTLAVYRENEPLRTEMVGFTVTSPRLAAGKVLVESANRVEDLFEASPVGWTTGSGAWSVMARYSCEPKWNYFGGYGPNTPTVWSKYRLDGDQSVDIYVGIKMQFADAPEEYARRFRDINLSICTDGAHLSSGYSLIRGGRPGGRPVTMLLRKGLVVATSSAPDHLVPGEGQGGHREWYAIRLEKRGGEIKAFIDNKPALTYVDPDPLSGGYAGCWTLNNGIMIGRVNLSAEKMTMGSPRAAAPLAVQETVEPLAVPAVALDGTPLALATFESGFDGWKERPGMTGRLVRERTGAPGATNTVLKVVNTYPAGDLSVTASDTACNLAATPLLHVDYCFDAGAQVNLYARKGDTWYEILLTGKEADDINIIPAGSVMAYADGAWRHLELNLGKLLAEAITRQAGNGKADLTVQEIVFADWSTPVDLRGYGFGNNSGGLAVRFDNFALTPSFSKPVTVTWQAPDKGMTQWRTSEDETPAGTATKDTKVLKASIPFKAGLRYLHVQGRGADGQWGPVVHIPITMANH